KWFVDRDAKCDDQQPQERPCDVPRATDQEHVSLLKQDSRRRADRPHATRETLRAIGARGVRGISGSRRRDRRTRNTVRGSTRRTLFPSEAGAVAAADRRPARRARPRCGRPRTRSVGAYPGRRLYWIARV